MALALWASVAAAQPTTAPASQSAADYRVHAEEVSDTKLKTQVAQHVVAPGPVNEAELRQALARLYMAASERTFQAHPKPTHVFIWVYPTVSDAEARKGDWIGMISKTPAEAQPVVMVRAEKLRQ